jgi:hypothetical protein
MEKQKSYEQLITEGIKGLPQELLAEIADFVYVVRKRYMQPQAFADELEAVLLEKADETNEDWLNLAGTISQDDLQLMAEAIEAGCERIDFDEW